MSPNNRSDKQLCAILSAIIIKKHYVRVELCFCIVCPAQSDGLVRYPTTQAPASGSLTVTTQCAYNAHVRTGSSLSVMCSSSGSWSRTTPQCECDTGYEEDDDKCKG